MLDVLTKSEAVAILGMLMINADDAVKQEEITSMLNNPFFLKHVDEKIGAHKKFLRRFTQARKQYGDKALEEKAIATLKSAFPAFQLKTLALMTLIAGADDHYDSTEKELIARVATSLGVRVEEVQPELEKMKEAILNQDSPPEEESDQDEATDE